MAAALDDREHAVRGRILTVCRSRPATAPPACRSRRARRALRLDRDDQQMGVLGGGGGLFSACLLPPLAACCRPGASGLVGCCCRGLLWRHHITGTGLRLN